MKTMVAVSTLWLLNSLNALAFDCTKFNATQDWLSKAPVEQMVHTNPEWNSAYLQYAEIVEYGMKLEAGKRDKKFEKKLNACFGTDYIKSVMSVIDLNKTAAKETGTIPANCPGAGLADTKFKRQLYFTGAGMGVVGSVAAFTAGSVAASAGFATAAGALAGRGILKFDELAGCHGSHLITTAVQPIVNHVLGAPSTDDERKIDAKYLAVKQLMFIKWLRFPSYFDGPTSNAAAEAQNVDKNTGTAAQQPADPTTKPAGVGNN